MKHRLSFELVRTSEFIFPDDFDQKCASFDCCTREDLASLAKAINSVRSHGLAQLLGRARDSFAFMQADYRKAVQKALRTLLNDIQLQGERIDFDIKWSKAGVVVITLRRGDPSKPDTLATNE